jgi:hypothetical protein
MKPSIAEVIRRISRFKPVHKAAHLSALISLEPRRSIRRVELEAALKDVISRQLNREIREDRRAS